MRPPGTGNEQEGSAETNSQHVELKDRFSTSIQGVSVGFLEGVFEGENVGDREGSRVGIVEGLPDGETVGFEVTGEELG